MFDIGFSELIVIGVVALIVLGPERLPKVARTTGHLLGRLQRYVADVKSDIHREMQIDELKRLQDEARQAALQMETSVRDEMAHFKGEVDSAVRGAASSVAELERELQAAAPSAEPDAQSEAPSAPSASPSADVTDADAAAQRLDRQLAEAEQHAGAPVFAEAQPDGSDAAMPDDRQLGFDFAAAEAAPAAKAEQS